MHYLWMQKVEKKIGVFMVTVKRKAVRGRTIELCEMRMTENEITFLLGAGTELEGHTLSLSTSDPEDIKVYDQINTFVSHLWSTTHKPFPVTVSFEKKKETEK